MAEVNSNVETALKIHEHAPGTRGWIEMAEAFVLATVAVMTAWSGYQATEWDALSAKHYVHANRITVMAQEKATLAGQERLYDIITFASWMSAKTARDERLAALFEGRFRPEYATAFKAWTALDPDHNPAAPPGPIFMPQYISALNAEAVTLSHDAEQSLELGVSARETGGRYVRVTVLLATVLFLTALGQRFRIMAPRVGILAVAIVLLLLSTYWMIVYPRA